LALFYVRSRYRLPAVPFLMIFAAAAFDWGARAVERGEWGPAVMVAVGLFIASLAVNHTYCEPAREDAPAICLGGDTWFDLEWQKLAEWHDQRGDVETALAFLHRAAAGASIRGPGGLQFSIGQHELHLAERAVDAREGAKASRHLDAAAAAFERTLRRSYRVAETQTALATVRRLQGHPEQALAASDAAVRARPDDPTVLLAALRLQAALGRCDTASRLRDDLRRVGAGDAAADQLVADCRT
jgi:hypothetical protein